MKTKKIDEVKELKKELRKVKKEAKLYLYQRNDLTLLSETLSETSSEFNLKLIDARKKLQQQEGHNKNLNDTLNRYRKSIDEYELKQKQNLEIIEIYETMSNALGFRKCESKKTNQTTKIIIFILGMMSYFLAGWFFEEIGIWGLLITYFIGIGMGYNCFSK